jgi:hypothetical protein
MPKKSFNRVLFCIRGEENSIKALQLLNDRGVKFSVTELAGTDRPDQYPFLVIEGPLEQHEWQGLGEIETYVQDWPVSDYGPRIEFLAMNEEDSSVN